MIEEGNNDILFSSEEIWNELKVYFLKIIESIELENRALKEVRDDSR